MKLLKVILIGNYSKDNQESMNRFVNMIANGLNNHKIDYEIWTPILFVGYFFKNTNSGIGKWVSYIDKYFITPFVFLLGVLKNSYNKNKVIYHICDHSNAVYVPIFPINKVIITCHDVLAIRGSLGFKDAHCNSRFFGKILQKNILKNLSKNIHIAFVSKNTLNQFEQIATNLFPDLEYEFGAQTHHNGLTISSFTNYIKNTWIPANLPDDVSSISSERINIL